MFNTTGLLFLGRHVKVKSKTTNSEVCEGRKVGWFKCPRLPCLMATGHVSLVRFQRNLAVVKLKHSLVNNFFTVACRRNCVNIYFTFWQQNPSKLQPERNVVPLETRKAYALEACLVNMISCF